MAKGSQVEQQCRCTRDNFVHISMRDQRGVNDPGWLDARGGSDCVWSIALSDSLAT
jgi:hypothetical protein